MNSYAKDTAALPYPPKPLASVLKNFQPKKKCKIGDCHHVLTMITVRYYADMLRSLRGASPMRRVGVSVGNGMTREACWRTIAGSLPRSLEASAGSLR